MPRVDASRVHAQMVDGLTRLERPAVELPGDTVRPLFLPVVGAESYVEQAVPVRVHGALPDPAVLAAADLRLKPLSVGGRAVANHPTNYTRMHVRSEFIGTELLSALASDHRTQGVKP